MLAENKARVTHSSHLCLYDMKRSNIFRILPLIQPLSLVIGCCRRNLHNLHLLTDKGNSLIVAMCPYVINHVGNHVFLAILLLSSNSTLPQRVRTRRHRYCHWGVGKFPSTWLLPIQSATILLG